MIIDGKQQAYKIKDRIFHCGTNVTLNFIGGKWKCVILWYLRNGSLRFSEIKRLIPDITEKMLSLQLKSLAQDQLIVRKAFGEKPPLRVQYALTDFGTSLIPVIEKITKWGITLAEAHGEIIKIE
ncbi:MAG: helix-turn-helix domain-containing protein [Saprospiraceae bacterium]